MAYVLVALSLALFFGLIQVGIYGAAAYFVLGLFGVAITAGQALGAGLVAALIINGIRAAKS